MIDGPHQVDQFLVHDPHDLLAGIERGEDFFANCPFGYSDNKVLDDRIADVGLKQGLFDEARPSRICSIRSTSPCH